MHTPHSLRHSYVTHLIEDGVDPKFVQEQVGRVFASTTALYTGISGDFTNTMMRKALDNVESTGTCRMSSKLDYDRLREQMAAQGMSRPPSSDHVWPNSGITLSASQVHRLVVDKPERLSPKGVDGAHRHPWLPHGRSYRSPAASSQLRKASLGAVV